MVRIDDDLWRRAHAVAEARGETVSDAIRRSLRRYVWRYEREQQGAEQ